MFDKTVTIEDLEESGKYDSELLDSLLQGDIWVLGENELTPEQRNDTSFMLPLLYATKNSCNTYEVYRYCGEKIQRDETLALEIISEQPQWFAGTVLSKDEKFIMETIKIHPEVEQYASPEIKEVIVNNDLEEKTLKLNFSTEMNMEIVLAKEIEEITKHLTDSPELRENREYMEHAVLKEASLLRFAAPELKKDPEFMEKVSTSNPKVIRHVVKTIEEFSPEAISAVREVSKTFTINELMDLIHEIAQTGQDGRYEKVEKKVEELGREHPLTIKFATAMVAHSDVIDPEIIKDVLDYSILTMEKFKNENIIDGQLEVSRTNLEQLITPNNLRILMEKLSAQGAELERELATRIDEYVSFYQEYKTQYMEMKKEDQERNMQQPEGEAKEEETKNPEDASTLVEVEKDTLLTPESIVTATIDAGVTTTAINEVVREAKVRQQYMQQDDRETEEYCKE